MIQIDPALQQISQASPKDHPPTCWGVWHKTQVDALCLRDFLHALYRHGRVKVLKVLSDLVLPFLSGHPLQTRPEADTN